MTIQAMSLNKDFVTKSREVVHALHDINLTIEEGQFVSVIGPSGCGKSTLLKILAGLLPSSSGHVILDGQPILKPTRDMGTVFQEARLLPWMTVLENVLLPARIHKLDPSASLQKARSLLELTGLADFASTYPFELSGGMQQRVAICRALVHDPEHLLMDEPFGALDAMTREHLNVELLRIWSTSQKTVVFITHSIPEAVFLSDVVVVMASRPGRIREVIQVDLPRPRLVESMSSKGFVELTAHLRSLFNAKGDLH